MRKPTISSRTRAATWVPRRIYYVLAYLKRQLAPSKPRPLSNYRIKEALGFGSEGEVSQIMRWLGGELPTKGRWSYGVLDTPQTYRFIVRERMPSGGYLITLLAQPEQIDPPIPEAVQLAFWDDPSMIPLPAHQDAANEGSSATMCPVSADRPRQDAAPHGSQRDQYKENVKESNKQQHGAHPQKNEWSAITIGGLDFLPIAALEKAGVTPQIFLDANRKILTRMEYNRPAQIRILIRSLLTHQPIYSAAELAAREEPHHERPARSAPTGARRRAASNRPAQTADPASPIDYAALIAEWQRTEPLGPIAMRMPGERGRTYGE